MKSVIYIRMDVYEKISYVVLLFYWVPNFFLGQLFGYIKLGEHMTCPPFSLPFVYNYVANRFLLYTF